MKVILTGGGTGGHIYPAIAIADKIKRKHSDADILFVGTEKGMERDLVPQNGYDIRFISASGINRKKLLKNVITVRDMFKGYHQAKNILAEFKPDIVIGTGGYVCGPVVRAAYRMGIKTFIHEQNAFPGITNRMLERYVEKVFISFPESAAYFKHPEKLVVTGNPIRKLFLVSGIFDYRQKLDLYPKDFMILCFGGSLGAGKINNVIEEITETLHEIPNLKLVFVTGKYYYEKILERLNEKGISEDGKISVFPYLDNIHEYLLAADLVISRAGALTISEITACGRASILIPSPNVTDNHQYFNAKVVADKGGAVLIEEKDLTPEKLIGTILRLTNNKEALNAMARASASVGKLDGVDLIYDQLGL
jgi:UDP-N-acetylglucosamine--N-acetylmuramyl-(pentapeptide) pyrophosphoryl-undecaprenol N-acetylglucosamine transferase